ncbi:MAG: asparagine synthase (glutamine-hydrolyzing) [Phycisphaerales bacterium]|nr:asparagine synthase (glutamine-hydrolyzing) [Phycisphaerales bacterium]
MCGIAAILNLDGSQHPVSRPLIERMRDRLAHRGPDDSGLWEGPTGSIGHRRLSVIDPSPAGHQPMISPDGRYVLAYNGELYNDHDLRSQLATLGVRFRSNCDSETLLHALIEWGTETVDKIRGMYSFVFMDTQSQSMIMARDPMGIKPLYHSIVQTQNSRQLVIASEVSAFFEHPQITKRPDPVTLSAYLSSIRTTLGQRTMFEGISALTPGQWISVPLQNPEQTQSANSWKTSRRTPTQGLQQTIEDSIHRHLRTDVPMCTLLSGGLDSAIITDTAMRSLGKLNTFCAGAKQDGFADDFSFASSFAQKIGSNHKEVVVDQDCFLNRWQWMIEQTCVPLSTPNEVAIYEVASALRKEGHIVALSGEGADELFGGYLPIMQQANEHVLGLNGAPDVNGGLFHLKLNAWISDELKPSILKDAWYQATDSDRELKEFYNQVFQESIADSLDDSPLQAHLQFQRRMNLPNLLQRLDTSTMLAGVEGRTPFADFEVAISAESMLANEKFIHGENPQTKIALRNAYKDRLPEDIVQRPKASFPLPFQQWMSPMTDRLYNSSIAREFFKEESLSLVCARPASYWHMAWPMINLMLWGECQFGDKKTQREDPTCIGRSFSTTTSC